VEKIEKGKRVTGTDLDALAKELRKQYTACASIRELSGDLGRSYGFVHRVLAQDGVTFRSRGGARKEKKKG